MCCGVHDTTYLEAEGPNWDCIPGDARPAQRVGVRCHLLRRALLCIYFHRAGIRYHAQTSSTCSTQGLLSVVARRLLVAAASLVAEHRLGVHGLQWLQLAGPGARGLQWLWLAGPGARGLQWLRLAGPGAFGLQWLQFAGPGAPELQWLRLAGPGAPELQWLRLAGPGARGLQWLWLAALEHLDFSGCACRPGAPGRQWLRLAGLERLDFSGCSTGT